MRGWWFRVSWSVVFALYCLGFFVLHASSGDWGWALFFLAVGAAHVTLLGLYWRERPWHDEPDITVVVTPPPVDQGIRFDMIALMAKIDGGEASDDEIDQVAAWMYSKLRYPSASLSDIKSDLHHLRDQRRAGAT